MPWDGRDRLDQLRFLRNDFAAQRQRVRLISLTLDQYPQQSAHRQTANEIRWGELEACFRPCALTSTSRALHSSWTGASRGDCSSPNPLIIQRSEKCNGRFSISGRPWYFPLLYSRHHADGIAGICINHAHQFYDGSVAMTFRRPCRVGPGN